ncbi:peptide/nickel transport system permease protein [Sphaerotilus hippei]|uniref:Peptide/nickel transport system permease protein n=1 Tax=Sphaerotilus hippei TaxID=744406 RepID=A0A318GZT9_9BURK|nr:ABC transporter permease [Sphaerotilus hippei]PXW95855.1 peptide/nickel transport system permease protein [Sphaerotilus hippei]
MSATPDTRHHWTRRSRGVWSTAWMRLRQDRVGMGALVVVLAYVLLLLAVVAGLLGRDWQAEKAVSWAPPTWIGGAAGPAAAVAGPPAGPLVDLSDVDPLAPRYAEWQALAARGSDSRATLATHLPMGADRLGRDVLAKAIQGTQISITVGLLAATLAALIGTVLGACAGFLGGRVGDALEWLYNVFTSIPGILLIFAFAAVTGRGVGGVVLILGLTGWTGIYRLVRAEFMKHASRDYVRAAEAIGASRRSRMFGHILPNVSHVVLVQLSIHVVGFIKYEVILSYLGLGVSVDQVSWGTMLAEAQSELIMGHWWQLATATTMMAVFVTAFSLMTDALRDALDPKLRGLEH